MTKIESYILKNGKTKYRFQYYKGIDPLTGKKQQSRISGFNSLTEAKIALSRLELELLEIGTIKKEHISSFQEIYDLWFPIYKRTVKESTWATTDRIFKLHILPVFKDYRVSMITVKECQKAVENWFNEPLVQYKRMLNYTSKVLDYSVHIGERSDNPCKFVIMPIDRQHKHHSNLENYYSKDELKTFLNYLEQSNNQQAFTFFRLLAFSGCRKSELLCLNWSDIDFRRNELSITKTQSRGDNNRLLIQTPKTELSNRVIKIEPKTMQILRKWKFQQQEYWFNFGFNINKKNNLIFSNEHNEMHKPTKTKKWLDSIIEKYGLKKVTTHAFRHTFATLAFESGATIKEVQYQLGHSNYKTTMDIYTAVTENQKSEASKKLANYVDF